MIISHLYSKVVLTAKKGSYMRKIFLGLLMLLSSYSFAEWRNVEDVASDLREDLWSNTTDRERWIRVHGSNREFGIDINKNTIGTHLLAQDKNSLTTVNIRHTTDYAKIIINFHEKNIGESLDVYLNLIDEDGFLIKKLFIGRIGPHFDGKIYGQMDISKDSFSQIKRYNLSYTGV